MELEGEFLKNTSVLVALFTDPRPIKEINDLRMKNLSESFNWFKAWENQHLVNQDKQRDTKLY